MAGIVLAGGRSSRMLRDKALLPWGEITLLQHVVDVVTEAVGSALVIADRADRYVVAGAQVAPDRFPGAGPLGGIVTGLMTLPDGYHIVVACDMPFLRVELLRLLMRLADGAPGAVPQVGGRLEPLCAAYHTACASRFAGMIEGGVRAAHIAVEACGARLVDESTLREVDPLPISQASIELRVEDDRVEIEASVSVTGKTGVEMEALTAVSIAALTIYDMVKAVDRSAMITDIRLESKSGGKSGEFHRGVKDP